MYPSQVYTVRDALKNYPLILEKEGSTITSGVEKILLKPRVKLVCSLSQLLVTCYLGIPPIRLIQEIRKFKRHSFRGARRYGQVKRMM